MSVPCIALAEKVRAVIAAATLSQVCTVERKYLARLDLENLTALVVTVSPGAFRTKMLTRSHKDSDHQVTVAIQKRVADAENATIDPLVTFVDELQNLFIGNVLESVPRAVCKEIEQVSEPADDMYLIEDSTFTSVFILNFGTTF